MDIAENTGSCRKSDAVTDRFGSPIRLSDHGNDESEFGWVIDPDSWHDFGGRVARLRLCAVNLKNLDRNEPASR